MTISCAAPKRRPQYIAVVFSSLLVFHKVFNRGADGRPRQNSTDPPPPKRPQSRGLCPRHYGRRGSPHGGTAAREPGDALAATGRRGAGRGPDGGRGTGGGNSTRSARRQPHDHHQATTARAKTHYRLQGAEPAEPHAASHLMATRGSRERSTTEAPQDATAAKGQRDGMPPGAGARARSAKYYNRVCTSHRGGATAPPQDGNAWTKRPRA